MENIEFNKINGLIYKMAHSFTTDKALVEDLYQQGILGLMKARENYIENSDAQFITYAKMYIYGEMFQYFNNNTKTFKTNKETVKMYKLIRKTNELLTQEMNCEPTMHDIATYLKIDEHIVLNVMNIMQQSLSLNYDYDEECELGNFVGYEQSYDDYYDLNALFDNLTDNEKQIIIYKYIEGYSQQEIADMLNISQSSVSRNEKECIRKMKARSI